MNTNLRQLEYFVKIAQCGSFSAAARELDVTQQALSKYMASLTKQCGTSLLDKHDGYLVLTAAGERYLEAANEMLSLVADTRRYVERSTVRVSSRIRFGIPPSYGIELVSTHIRDFKETYPEIQIELLGLDTLNLRSGVKEGRLDLAICSCLSPEEMAARGLRAIPLYKREFGICVPTNHRLAHAGRELQDCPYVEPDEFCDTPFILFEKSTYLYEHIEPMLMRWRFSPKIAATVTSEPMIVPLLTSGYGVAVSRCHPEQSELCFLRLRDPAYAYFSVLTLPDHRIGEPERYMLYMIHQDLVRLHPDSMVYSDFIDELYKEFS